MPTEIFNQYQQRVILFLKKKEYLLANSQLISRQELESFIKRTTGSLMADWDGLTADAGLANSPAKREAAYRELAFGHLNSTD